MLGERRRMGRGKGKEKKGRGKGKGEEVGEGRGKGSRKGEGNEEGKGEMRNERRETGSEDWGARNVFLTMYFGLPRYIPPRPLGETRVRKHWSTKYTLSLHYFTMILHVHSTSPAPYLGEEFYARKQRCTYQL